MEFDLSLITACFKQYDKTVLTPFVVEMVFSSQIGILSLLLEIIDKPIEIQKEILKQTIKEIEKHIEENKLKV